MAYAVYPPNPGLLFGPPVDSQNALPNGVPAGSLRAVMDNGNMSLYGYDGSTWNSMGGDANGTFETIKMGHDTGSVRSFSGSFNTAPLTDGQVLIGSSGNQPIPATITGTPNRVSVTNASGSITLSLPQDIHTAAAPVFAGLRVGSATGAAYLDAGVLNAAPLADGQILIGRTGATPIAASITGTANRVAVTLGQGTINLTLPQDIHAGASPTFVSLTLTSNLNVTGTVKFSGPGIGLGTALIRKADGSIMELTSSRIHKENIHPLKDEHDSYTTITKLRPRVYNYKAQTKEDKTFGFIAEEVEEFCREAVLYKDGIPHSLNYNAFIPVIVDYLQNAQEGNKRIIVKCKELEDRIKLINNVNNDLSHNSTKAENFDYDKKLYVAYAIGAAAFLLSIIRLFV